MKEIMEHVAFGVWLLSLSIMFLRFIQVTASVLPSFLCLNNIPLCVYDTIYLSIHLFMGTGFPPLSIINNTAINICIHDSG